MVKGHTIYISDIMRLLVIMLWVLCIFFIAHQGAYANAPTLLITEVQTQSELSKTEEFIEIYNVSTESISLDTFEVSYFSAANQSGSALLVTPSLAGTSLKSHEYLLLHQVQYVLGGDGTFSTNGMSDTGGHVQIKLHGEVIDTVGWGTAAFPETAAALVAEKGMSISRKVASGVFQDTQNNSEDFIETPPSPTGGGIIETPIDVCMNIEGVQIMVPANYQVNEAAQCQLVPVCQLEISEISSQPNYNGQEYIEFINTASVPAAAKLCSVSINGGVEKILPAVTVDPGAYAIMTFSSGAIKNAAGSITLVHSDGRQSSYAYPETMSGQTVNLNFGSTRGEVSDQPTPGAQNETILSEDETELEASTPISALTDCPQGKYRNPETNRCKNIELAVATLVPCDEGSVRNPETNRCRKIVSTSASLAPCKAGQERNPETNRCRSIGSEAAGLKPCEAGQERNPDTNRCRKVLTPAQAAVDISAEGALKKQAFPRLSITIVASVFAALLGYGAYEYRTDITDYVRKIREAHARGRPPG